MRNFFSLINWSQMCHWIPLLLETFGGKLQHISIAAATGYAPDGPGKNRTIPEHPHMNVPRRPSLWLCYSVQCCLFNQFNWLIESELHPWNTPSLLSESGSLIMLEASELWPLFVQCNDIYTIILITWSRWWPVTRPPVTIVWSSEHKINY